MSNSLTDQQRAELRLRAAEAEVQAAREALDQLSPATIAEGYEKPERADYTHEWKLSERQTHILAEALEFYCRWCAGHFVLPNVVEFRRVPANSPSGWPHPRAGQPAVEDYQLLRDKLDEVRALLFPEFRSPGQHGGVGWSGRHDQQHMMIAYELRKSLVSERNRRLGIDNVDSNFWLHYSDQPKPLVHVYDPELGVKEWQEFLAENAAGRGVVREATIKKLNL